jgi:hypothetical protein
MAGTLKDLIALSVGLSIVVGILHWPGSVLFELLIPLAVIGILLLLRSNHQPPSPSRRDRR